VDPGLLDAVPQLPARFADLPVSTRHKLYQAFGIEILFNHGKHQITCRATITTSTPHTVTAIINDTQPPTPTSSDSPYTPVGANIRTGHELGGAASAAASAVRDCRAISMSSRAAMTRVRTAAPGAEMSQSG
jgi:hypothetical protein